MLIGTEKKFIFVANTKTASTSIEAALAPYADIRSEGGPEHKHLPLVRIPALYPQAFKTPGQGFDSFFRFGVMRDPIDWIWSWFRYRRGNKTDSPLPADMSFEEFWERQDWNLIRADGSRYLQFRMFCGANRVVLADMILPYDKLNSLFADICDGLGIDSPLPRENVSRLTQAVEIPEHLQAKIQDHFAPDYDLYNRLDTINAAGLDRLRHHLT